MQSEMSDTSAAEEGTAAFGAVLGALTNFVGNPVIGTILRHRVADHLDSGALSAEGLGHRSGLDPLSAVRALRFLATFGVFRETEPGVFSNTPASKLLRDKPGGLRNVAWVLTTDAHMQAIAGIAHGLVTGQSSFAHVNGVTFWEYLRSRPEENKAFDAMFAELRAGEHVAITDAYDWSGIHNVVDVGGGNGSLLATILERQLHLQGILFDQEEVFAAANNHLIARGVRDRCDLVTGNFFSAIQATADVWLLSQVLHDWSDAECKVILSNCRAQMRRQDRLIVAEMITVPCNPHPLTAMNDMVMLTLFGNARQRTREEYTDLFASCGLELTRVIDTNSPFSLAEARIA